MDIVKAIIVAIVEGLTEYLPISSAAHMGFTAALLGMEETEYLKMFQVSIQFGAILSIVVLYWKKFFDFLYQTGLRCFSSLDFREII